MAYRIEVAILQFRPAEKKAPKGPFLRSINTTLKPKWIKIRLKRRREREKLGNKKATYLKESFKWSYMVCLKRSESFQEV